MATPLRVSAIISDSDTNIKDMTLSCAMPYAS